VFVLIALRNKRDGRAERDQRCSGARPKEDEAKRVEKKPFFLLANETRDADEAKRVEKVFFLSCRYARPEMQTSGRREKEDEAKRVEKK
jgi:hypothetical protein